MGTVVINNNSEFKENSSTSSDGGAISNSGQLIIDNSSFSENQANFGEGGAVANFSTGTISITNSSISANTSMYGAGIINEGNTTITSTEIKMNSASHGGGGILNGLEGNGSLSFINGTISGNSAPYGGGVFNLSNNGSVTLANCSITGNTATNSASGHGGGVSNFVKITINNCTIANNSAQHYGGGIFSTGSLIVNNSTVSNNSALTSGGIEFYGEFSLRNSIIANSLTGKDCFSSGGTIVQNINNLIEDNAISPNQCGTPILTSNPNLAPLANNGGTTQTMALLTNSPAINAGDDNTCETADQRGVPRPQGSHCDLGAFEYQDLIAPLVTSIIRTSTSPSSASTVDFTVTFSESVQNVDVNDFSLTTTGVTGVSITGVTPVSALVYTVSVNTGSGNGTIRLNVPSTATIKDLSDNDLSGLPFSSGEVYTISKSTSSIAVTIGGVNQGNYTLSPNTSQILKYNLDGGPVVLDGNGVNIIASLNQWRRRPSTTVGWTGVAQSMGLPVSLITDTYYFPRYDYSSTNALYNTLLIANVDTVSRDITITIGGVVRGTYTLAPSQSQYVNYPGLVGGPVVVSSASGAKIVASLYELIRDPSAAGWNGQNEMMGLPATQLSDQYIIPNYFGAANPKTLNASFHIANVDTVSTTVEIWIAGVLRGSYPLAASTGQVVKYNLDGGPVEIRSTNGAKIVASLNQWRRRPSTTVGWTGVAQSMALPVSLITDTYYFPRYDYSNTNALYNTLLIANVDTVSRDITITIGGVVRGTYTLAPSQIQYVNYPGLVGGPVVVSSASGAKIVASLYELIRDPSAAGWNGQSEMMGLPATQLSDQYIIPNYFGAANPKTLNASLYIAVP
ncbi:MAG: choice-of-anchor Q domain-containing protein [Anaerolineales bacterium]